MVDDRIWNVSQKPFIAYNLRSLWQIEYSRQVLDLQRWVLIFLGGVKTGRPAYKELLTWTGNREMKEGRSLLDVCLPGVDFTLLLASTLPHNAKYFKNNISLP